jgi:hypothetical protein
MNNRQKRKLEAERGRTLSEIGDEKGDLESMMQRATASGGTPNQAFFNGALTRLADLVKEAMIATTSGELTDLGYEADRQGQLRAYICPQSELEIEGVLALDSMEEWNIPRPVLDRLRNSLIPQLKEANTNIQVAQSALRAIYEEQDTWDRYTTHYEDTMSGYSHILFLATLSLLTAAIVTFHFRQTFLVGLVCAGAAGSCTSVISKMPLLSVGLSGELEAYQRRILSRISVGIVASLIGCAFLGWGVLPISIQNQSFSDVINACSTSGGPCTALKQLILICVPMLFGFSERALTSFEQRFFGKRD